VRRHRGTHLPTAMVKVKANAAADVVHADNLLEQARELQAKALGILAKAEGAGDLRTAVAACREARGCFELLARLLGEIHARPQVAVNVLASPEWLSVRAAVFAALDGHPDARADVAGRLLELEAGRGR
jgi:hypothetical protein